MFLGSLISLLAGTISNLTYKSRCPPPGSARSILADPPSGPSGPPSLLARFLGSPFVFSLHVRFQLVRRSPPQNLTTILSLLKSKMMVILPVVRRRSQGIAWLVLLSCFLNLIRAPRPSSALPSNLWGALRPSQTNPTATRDQFGLPKAI